MRTHIIKATVKGIKKPPIWREIQLPTRITFYELHNILQAAFAFTGLTDWSFSGLPGL